MDTNQKTLVIVIIILMSIGAIAYSLKMSADAVTREKAKFDLIVEPMLVDISSTWHPKTFYKYSSPELVLWLKENGWDAVNRYSELGKMIEYNNIEALKKDDGEVELVFFVDFENGETKVKMHMLNYKDEWYINNLKINPAE